MNITTVTKAAEQLNVSEETVRRLLKKGELPGKKHGSMWVIATKDLARYMARRVAK